MTARTLTLAHSSDADDAFMFYALAQQRIEAGELRFEHVLADIETLNQAALRATYDVTAISFHAYAYLHRHYALLRCGSSFGEGYGPVVVAREPISPQELTRKRVAVPGLLTSAYLLLKLYAPEAEVVALPFDRILDAVAGGEADAGLIIHEGQLTYGQAELVRVVDLGAWWKDETGLPVPLGGLAVRRGLDAALRPRIAAAVEASVRYAIDHREEALAYAVPFGRGVSRQVGDKFVGMYVNELTLDCGERGRQAIELLLERAFEKRLVPEHVAVDLQPT
ncbi:MAG: menaquinone biosynthesis family protein [Candidatus Acidiferrales bacterium]